MHMLLILLTLCLRKPYRINRLFSIAYVFVGNGCFSVVLFRPNFMLASEEYPMKAHKNQWLLATPSPPAIPCGGTNQGTHHGVWRADIFAVTWDGTIPRDVGFADAWTSQTTFTGYKREISTHTCWNHDTEKSGNCTPTLPLVLLSEKLYKFRILVTWITYDFSY